MFRKIVTESGYSPALAARLGEYTKKLREETTRRQIGLVFVLLSVVVQLFSTLYPPESANAHNPEIFIDGGIHSIEDYLNYYDQNTAGVRDLLASIGISRSNIETATSATLAPAPDMVSWFMHNTRNKKDATYTYPTSDGDSRVAYYRPLTYTDALVHAYVGSSSQGWFAISKEDGTLISKSPSLANSESIASSLSVSTISSQFNAAKGVQASDSIKYTLTAENSSDTAAMTPVSVNLEDILEYAQVIDRGGGQFNTTTKTLSWPDVTLAPREALARSFIVRLLPSIPATAQGQYVTSSYDCTISASFGTTVDVPVSCPPVKYIEQLINDLPRLSKEANLLFVALLLTLSLYLMLRSKQLLSELYIIRHNHLGSL